MVVLRLSLQNLWGARHRSLLLGLALSLVAFLWVIMLALSGGIRASLLRSATTLATGHLNVSGYYKSSAGDVAAVLTDVARLRRLVRARTPGVAEVRVRNRGWGKVISETSSIQTGMIGYGDDEIDDLLDALTPVAEYGDTPALIDDEGMARLPSLWLFADQAERLRVEPGDGVTLRIETLGGQTNTMDAIVGMIAEDMGLLSSFSVLMPSSALAELYQFAPDTAGVLHVVLDDIDRADSAAAALRQALLQGGHELLEPSSEPFFVRLQELSTEAWRGQKIDVTVWRDEVSYLTWILTALTTLTALLSSILAGLIAIGVMNVQWIAVRERTTEIGTLRAIGMSRARVGALFVIESLTLGFAAAMCGAWLGGAAAKLLDLAEIPVPLEALRAILMSNTLRLHVEASSLLGAACLLTGIVGLSALWPALRAARIAPVTAIQSVA